MSMDARTFAAAAETLYAALAGSLPKTLRVTSEWMCLTLYRSGRDLHWVTLLRPGWQGTGLWREELPSTFRSEEEAPVTLRGHLESLTAIAGDRILRAQFSVGDADEGRRSMELIIEACGSRGNVYILLDGKVHWQHRMLRANAGDPRGLTPGRPWEPPPPPRDIPEEDSPQPAFRMLRRAGKGADIRGASVLTTNWEEVSSLDDAFHEGLLLPYLDFRVEERRRHMVQRGEQELAKRWELIDSLTRDLDKARNYDRLRIMGETLLIHGREIERGTTLVRFANPYDPNETLEIPLDPARSVHTNAQDTFKRYRKARDSVTKIESRIAEECRKAETLQEKIKAWAAQASDDLPENPQQVMTEKTGQVRRLPFRRYTSSDGLAIWVGRSAAENDMLTFTVATPHDWWLHASQAPGAHVVVKSAKRLTILPPATLLEAAALAAHYSDDRHTSAAAVIVTQRKYVRKLKHGSPGQVTFQRGDTVMVRPGIPFTVKVDSVDRESEK